jgi:hypothetical protein
VLPVLQSCLSFLIPKSVFKEVSQCISTVNILNFDQFNFHFLSLTPSIPPSLFNSLQYISLCPLPTEMQCISILVILYYLFSFLFPPPSSIMCHLLFHFFIVLAYSYNLG